LSGAGGRRDPDYDSDLPEDARVTRLISTPQTFSHLVENIAALAANHELGGVRDVSVRNILNAIGRRAFGPLLLLVGLFSISPATIMPGMTWLAAAVALLLSVQMVFGARHPWLPRPVLNACLTRESVRAASDYARPWAQRIDRHLKPRLTVLAEAPFVNFAGLLCAAAALATFPLGLIPVAPVAPGLAITLVGLGLFIKDGVLLLFGGVVVGGALWLALATVL
jgi:hypothetical protein